MSESDELLRDATIRGLTAKVADLSEENRRLRTRIKRIQSAVFTDGELHELNMYRCDDGVRGCDRRLSLQESRARGWS